MHELKGWRFAFVLTVLSVVSASQVAHADLSASELKCRASAFDGLVDATAADPDDSVLPRSFPMSVGHKDAVEMYELGRASWEGVYDAVELDGILKQIGKSGTAPSPATMLKLRAIRQRALLMNYIFSTCDENHEAPQALKRFSRDFGRLGDALSLGDYATARDLSADIRDEIDGKSLQKAIRDFTPASRDSISEYFLDEINDIEKITRRDGNTPIEDFHEVRKTLRELMATLRLLAAGRPGRDDPNYRSAVNFLLALNIQMGKIHDFALARDDYNSLTVDMGTGAVYTRQGEKIGQPLGRTPIDVRALVLQAAQAMRKNAS